MWSAIASALSLALTWGALLVLALVLVGALSQLFARAKTIDKPYDGDLSAWHEVSPLVKEHKRPPVAEPPRRSVSSKGVAEKGSPTSRQGLTRQLSAPNVGDRPQKPALSPRLQIPGGRSSSSGSSVFEKAKKNWLLNLDDGAAAAKKDLQASPVPSHESTSNEDLRGPPASPVLSGLADGAEAGGAAAAAKSAAASSTEANNNTSTSTASIDYVPLRPPSSAAASPIGSPRASSSMETFPVLLSLFVSTASVLMLLCAFLFLCFNISQSPPLYSLSCPTLPTKLHLFLYSCAQALAVTVRAVRRTVDVAGLSSLLSNAAGSSNASLDFVSDPASLYAYLIMATITGILIAVVLGACVKLRVSLSARRPVTALPPLKIDYSHSREGSTTSSSSGVDVVGAVVTELETLGLEVYRADPRGVQLPENVNLDNLEKSQVFVLVLLRDEFSREASLMELKLALERGMPFALLREAGCKANGPSEFVQLVEATAHDPSVLVVDFNEDDRLRAAQAVLSLVARTSRECAWQAFVSHSSRPRIDSSLHRPVSPIPERGPVVVQPITTVRDSLAVLVAHVSDRESVSALSRLVVIQGNRGYLAPDETKTLIAVLRAKGLISHDSGEVVEVDTA